MSTFGSARYVGRVGALAVALGIGAAVTGAPAVAWAEPDTAPSADGAATPTEAKTTEAKTTATDPGPVTESIPAATATSPTASLAKPTTKKSRKATQRHAATAAAAAAAAKKPAAATQAQPAGTADQPSTNTAAAAPAAPVTASAAPAMTGALRTATASSIVQQAVPTPTTPPLISAVKSFLTALAAPFLGSGSAPHLEFPGLWVLLAAARRQLGLSDTTARVTETQTVSALSVTTAAATVPNQQPVVGTPTLGDPNPTTGAVTGQVVASDPEGKALSYALVTPPALGTVTVSKTGAFTYTPTAAQRVQAGVSSVSDAQFTVSVYDGVTAKVSTTVAVPINPTPVQLLGPVPTADQTYAVAASNTRAYVANSDTGTVTVINTLDGTVVTTIATGSTPTAVVVKADGKLAYVANSGNNTISVIDTATNTVKKQIVLTFTPTALAISPSGGTLYVGNATGRALKLNASTGKNIAWMNNTEGTTSFAVSPDGKKVYATTAAGVAVVSSSWSSNTAKLLAAGGTSAKVLATSRDSTKVYIATGATTVTVLETTGYTAVGSLAVTGPVQSGLVNKDGSLLLTVGTDGLLTAFDTITNTALTSLDTGSTARGMAASTDGMQIYVTDTSALRVVSLVPTNAIPVLSAPTDTGNTSTGISTGSFGVADADADPLKITVLTAPTKGKVTFAADGTYTYTPTATARHIAASTSARTTDLTDRFTFTADDGRRGIVTQTVTVTIVPGNTTPTVKVSALQTNTSGVVTGAVTATDANKDKIVFDGSYAAMKGTVVVGGDGKFSYTPTVTARHAAATGDPSAATDTFTVTVDDGHGGVVANSITVTITPLNAAPTNATVSALTTSTHGTGRVTGLVTVANTDGDTLVYTATGAAKGAVQFNPDGTFSYTPTESGRAQGTGTDSFIVTVSDGHGGATSVTVNVGVTGSAAGNTVPVPASTPYTANVNSSTGVVTGQVTATDAGALSYLLDAAVPGTAGSVLVNSNGTYTFTPSNAARYDAWFTPAAATFTFTVAASDGQDATAIDVTVPVTALHPDADGTLTLAELKALAANGNVDIGMNAAGTIVRNIDGTFSTATVTDAASAAAALNHIAALLGAPAGFATAAHITTGTVGYTGESFYRLRLTKNGLDVLGSEVVLSTDDTGRVTGVFSNYDPELAGVNTTPSASIDTAAEAIALVQADLLDGLGGTPSTAVKDAFFASMTYDTALVIYDENPSNNFTTSYPPRLAWQVVATSKPDSVYPTVGSTYQIYANGTDAGTIFSEFASAQYASTPVASSGKDLLGATRTISAGNTGSTVVLTDVSRDITTYLTNYVSTGWSGLPLIPGNSIAYTGSWSTAAVSAQANAARVYDYYTTILGRHSFDDAGAPVVLSIDYNPSGSSAAGWRNAAWDGHELVFGDSGNTQAALDLVGHEYTHAVIQYVSGLAYVGESGALNEAYADIMGSLIENKTGSARWLFAEDAAGNPYRNMADPSQYGQRELYTVRYLQSCGCSTDDFGYVHSNSGIMSFAAYKMMTATADEISGEQWARVFYDSLYRLPSTATMVDARFAVIASARANGFTDQQIVVVKTAFDAVGVTTTAAL